MCVCVCAWILRNIPFVTRSALCAFVLTRLQGVPAVAAASEALRIWHNTLKSFAFFRQRRRRPPQLPRQTQWHYSEGALPLSRTRRTRTMQTKSQTCATRTTNNLRPAGFARKLSICFIQTHRNCMSRTAAGRRRTSGGHLQILTTHHPALTACNMRG